MTKPRPRPGGRKRRLHVAIAGLGLIGGSLARALRKAGHDVTGLDRPLIVRRALAMGAITRGVPSGVSALRQVLGQVDVLVLAASPRANTRLLRAVADEAPSHVVVTDVGSVKAPIMAEVRRLGLRRFVGGHPIAGNEGQGLASSSPDLFRGRAWALTPETAAPAAVTVVRSLVRAVGARPIVIRARAHDRALAFLSHVPHIVAWAIDAAAQGDRITKAHLDLAGPGFRDMTRLARSPRALWREILEENEAEVRRALAALLSRGVLRRTPLTPERWRGRSDGTSA